MIIAIIGYRPLAAMLLPLLRHYAGVVTYGMLLVGYCWLHYWYAIIIAAAIDIIVKRRYWGYVMMAVIVIGAIIATYAITQYHITSYAILRYFHYYGHTLTPHYYAFCHFLCHYYITPLHYAITITPHYIVIVISYQPLYAFIDISLHTTLDWLTLAADIDRAGAAAATYVTEAEDYAIADIIVCHYWHYGIG